ncbi:LptF/LptG family permease [Nitrosophilus kaiyonis]|uniref:LptF/LptG family permease n=1 Tax=Nitrosophilus kaiyonis TaxID=2930200 RepID=UPI00248F5B69|nr:LptF/LptG family permease [Nitrosophilus kaiyonis]
MVRLNRYINQNFSTMFFSIFFPLFSIASLIFFIKVVSITSIIKVDFLELLELYMYVLPQIFFYTIPVAFFVSAVMTLSKLSYDYEMIVIFSLGIKPFKIAHILGKMAFLASTALLMLSLVIIPQAKQMYKGFIAYKKAEAIFNIKPSEYGQKFGDWLLFIENQKGKNRFENIVLYNQKVMNKENFIVAKEAVIKSDKEGLKFILNSGTGYTYENGKLDELHFERMVLNDLSVLEAKQYKNVIEYWFESTSNKTRAFDFTIFVIVSLFPMLSIFLILALGIKNPRYQKNFTYLWIILSISIFYVLAFILSKKIPFIAIFILSILWLFFGYILYKKYVLKRY